MIQCLLTLLICKPFLQCLAMYRIRLSVLIIKLYFKRFDAEWNVLLVLGHSSTTLNFYAVCDIILNYLTNFKASSSHIFLDYLFTFFLFLDIEYD